MTRMTTTAIMLAIFVASSRGIATPESVAGDAHEPQNPPVTRDARGALSFDAQDVRVAVGRDGATFRSPAGSVTFTATSVASEATGGGGIRTIAAHDRQGVREEWFLPTARGVEHIIIADVGVEGGRTTITIGLDGAFARLEDEQTIAFADADGRVQLIYAGLHVWDSFHHQQTAWFEVTSTGFSIVVETDQTTVGPLTIDPLASGPPQTINGVTAGEFFGQGIGVGDIDNDGADDLAVGATDAGGINRGVIRVFKGVPGSGLPSSPTFNINLSTAQINDDCGDAVEIGDVNGDEFDDIIYSCRNSSPNGKVLVHLGPSPSTTTASFVLTDANCTQPASRGGLVVADIAGGVGKEVIATCGNGRLVAWNVDANGAGAPVASFALLDPVGPGRSAMIAALKLDPDAEYKSIVMVGSSAAARVYVGGQGSDALLPSSNVPITIPTSDTTEHTLAAGDFDGDGDDDLIIGDDAAFSNQGRAYTFVNNIDTLATFTRDSSRTFIGGAGHRRGKSIGLADLNKDNHADATVCRPGAAGGAGTCDTFRGSPNGLEVNGYFTITGTSRLGDTPEISAGDFRGDGGRDLVVPEIYAGSDRGAVSIRNFTPSTIKGADEIAPEPNIAGAAGGTSLAFGDLNGDGIDDLVVGADGYGSGLGAVFVYFGGALMNATPDWCTSGSQAGEAFGRAVTVARVRGPGTAPSLIVGAPEYDGVGQSSGRIRLYNAPLTGGCTAGSPDILPARGTFNGAVVTGLFGSALANAGNAISAAGDGVVVGAPGTKDSFNGRVVAMPSSGLAAGLTTLGSVTFLGSAVGCHLFGSSVANAGNVQGSDPRDDILVGASGCDTGALTDNGQAFLLQSAASPALTLSSWSFAGVASNDNLGVVAGLGDVSNDGIDDFAVGAPFEDNTGTTPTTIDAGRVRVFRGSATGTPTTSPGVSMSTSFSGRCGSAISGRVDFNRDGRMDVIIGEPGYANGVSQQGRVRVFFGNATGIIDSVPEHTLIGGAINRAFGSAVATGDLLGDTHGDYAASMPGYTNTESAEGRVVVRSGEW